LFQRPHAIPKFRLSRLAAFVFLGSAFASSQSANPVAAVNTTLCELAQNPEAFNGKMIRVRASAMGTKVKDLLIDDFEQKPACSASMWVEVVLPDQVRPKPGFDTVQDGSFQRFVNQMKSMNVQATFEGRFDVAAARTGRKRHIAHFENEKGFGKGGRSGGRIVLNSVSDVVARYIPRR
jgi:hypothetical protein